VTPLLRHWRARLEPVFGQIRPLKRPLGCARSGKIPRGWRGGAGHGPNWHARLTRSAFLSA